PSAEVRLHLWTESVDASVHRIGSPPVSLAGGAVPVILRLARPIALLLGARGVLRDPGSGRAIGGVTVLDPHPPRGISRRRMTPERLASLDLAVSAAGDSG